MLFQLGKGRFAVEISDGPLVAMRASPASAFAKCTELTLSSSICLLPHLLCVSVAVKLRIRATNNVAKITNVMKLVASSKLKAVEDALAKGRVFGVSAHLCPNASSSTSS